MRIIKASLAMILAVVINIVASSNASAVSIVDQSNLLGSGFGWTAMSWDQSQTFQPSMSILTGVDIDLVTGNPHLGDNFTTVEIFQSGVLLATATQLVSVGFEGLLHFDFSSGVPLNIGETYTLNVPGTKDTFGWKFSGGDAYPNGDRYLGGVLKPSKDWLFQTYGRVASVPVPATLPLLLIGLAGIGVFERRRKKIPLIWK